MAQKLDSSNPTSRPRARGGGGGGGGRSSAGVTGLPQSLYSRMYGKQIAVSHRHITHSRNTYTTMEHLAGALGDDLVVSKSEDALEGCLPSAMGQMPEATRAATPEEDPPV